MDIYLSVIVLCDSVKSNRQLAIHAWPGNFRRETGIQPGPLAIS